MEKMNILAFLTMAFCVSDTMGYMSYMSYMSRSTLKARTPNGKTSLRSSSLNDLSILAAPLLLSSKLVVPSRYVLSTTTFAELLADVAHVSLDLSPFLGPATPALRLGIVIGRLCAIASDYIPDQYMNPEEVIFQGVMLVAALTSFQQSLHPIILGATTKTTFRDQQAQHMLQGHGISWTQYKAMSFVALDWVDMDSDEYLEDDEDCMYWLYNGYVHLHIGNMNFQMIHAGSRYHSLLGDFAQLLDKKTKNSNHQKPVIKAGGSGATLLRIRTKKLRKLMDHDQRLSESIHSLLVKGITEKLSAFFED